MGRPVIGYENLLENASSITVTSEAAGFERELAYNWRTFDGWRASASGTVHYTVDLGSAQNVSYWAVSKHTLGTNGGSIVLQYSTTGAFAGEEVDFGATVSPSDDTTIMQYVTTPINARYWRWEIVSTPVSFFGVMSLGLAMEFVRAVRTGFQLPLSARKNKIINSRSEGGAFLGRSLVRQGFESSFTIELQTLAYGRTTWNDFIDHAELKPFFFAWNTSYMEDSIFAWMDMEADPVTFDRNNTVAMGFKFQGLP